MGHNTSINLFPIHRLSIPTLKQTLLIYQSGYHFCLHAVVGGGKEIHYCFGEGHFTKK